MKLISLFCFSILFYFAVPAHAQFRASIMGGPKISYTQNIGTGVHTNIGKGGYQGGAYFGYNFRKPDIIVETGVNFARFDVVFDYYQDLELLILDKPDRTFHYKSYTAFQIPLRIKGNIMPATSKVAIRPVAGLLLTLKNTRDWLLPDEPFTLQPDNNGFYYIHDGYQERIFFFPIYGQYETDNLLCIEGGLEVGYKLSPKIEVIGSVSYQNGLKTMDSHVVHIQQEPAMRGNEIYATTASSRLESLNFNIGVAYSFKKKE